MTTILDDLKKFHGVPSRAPRKQSLPHRAPSNDDLSPGRTFTIAFGLMGSQNLNQESQFLSCHIASCSSGTLDSDFSAMDVMSPSSEGHLMTTKLPDHEDIGQNCGAVHTLMATEPPVNKPQSVTLSVFKPSPVKGVSLADQYLDTMIMDDVWRAACWRKIRQNKRKIKRLNTQLCRNSLTTSSHYPKPISKTCPKEKIKPKNTHPTSSINLKPRHRKHISPRGSDSGFVSSSPTPGPPAGFRVRSTRNYPTQPPNTTTISIDISPSMVGRSCLSCGCTNTTCWRRTLGGIICNSCGLRYKKCGIICADNKCRYVPTRSEISEMQNKGVRGAEQCYACHGDVIICGDDVRRSG